MDKEMELLLSEKEVKLANGKRVVVKRIALLDTIRLTARLSGIVGAVMNSSENFTSALAKIAYNGELVGGGKDTESNINSIRMMGIVEAFNIIGEDGTELLKDILVKSTTLTDEDVEQIDCVDGIDILFDIYEVNKSFFGKCWSKLKGKVGKKKPEKKTK